MHILLGMMECVTQMYLTFWKDKDNVVAEYSLEEVSQPIGIAGYELSNALSKEY